MDSEMRYYLRRSGSKRKRDREHSPEEDADPEDEILSGMLLDVPTSTVNSPSVKPLKIQSAKRNRLLADPKPPVTSSVKATSQSNGDEVINPQSSKSIYEQMATQESVMSNKLEDTDDVIIGIEAVPLDENTKSNLEFHESPDGKQFTRLYWYDCCEEAKNPGTVYFFGRIFAKTTNRYVSCCTVVKNIKRTIYLLIANDSNYDEAVSEFTHITAKKFKIKNFTCQKVTKKYAFSSDSTIPLTADYVQVDYPAVQNALPAQFRGETFTHVLNSNQTPMEKIILELKLRGPCWLNLFNPEASPSPLTWTKIELVLESPNDLQVEKDTAGLKTPYFSVLSLSLLTHASPNNPGKNDLIAISVMVNTAFNLDECLKRTNKASGHFLIMTKPSSTQKDSLRLPYDFQASVRKFNRTKFELVNSDRDLLTNFLEKFSNIDPDIVVGHDLLNFDFETLIKFMISNKVGQWSKLGRFKRSTLVSTKKAFPYLFNGRILCDIKKSAVELIQLRSYDLTELTSKILDKVRIEYDHAALVEAFQTSDGLIRLLNAAWEDVDNIFSILVELNVIPLALKITNITGNILSRTLAAGRSERNEYLLLHAFHDDNFICPEKQNLWERKGGTPKVIGLDVRENLDDGGDNVVMARKKAAYTGGLVLEPKTGFYETCILLMDFNSLYPSIIQEFNICFSSVKVPSVGESKHNGEIIASPPDSSVEIGVLPTQLKNLVDRRRQVKRLMADSKNPMEKMLLDIEQRALKLTANSMYGCLGFEHSRFYAKHLASLVTFKGREILMSTKAMVEELGYEVIYGDTDSLMIDTKIVDYDEVIQRGNSIKHEINKTFKLLEIDIDGVYRPLLLLKKKNYAGASIKKSPDGSQLIRTIETKGLDTVRRDRAVIAKEAGEKVLTMILTSDKDSCQIVEDIHSYLKELGISVKGGELPIEKFLISKQLNKNPEDYKDTKGIGHVSVALRCNKDPKKARKMRFGDTVEYVICTDNTTESANQRCYSVDELKNNPELKLDYEYYLCQQIHPVLTRICDKLPTTNSYVLAEMLGVESSNQIHIKQECNVSTKRDQLVSKGDARFNSCKPLKISCQNCNFVTEISTRTVKSKAKRLELSVRRCTNCNAIYSKLNDGKPIVVQMIELIRNLTLEVYSGKFVCENSDCNHTTRNVFGALTNDGSSSLSVQPSCDLCGSAMFAEMDDRKMDSQLAYMKYLFDVDRIAEQTPVVTNTNGDDCVCEESTLQMYRDCYNQVDNALRTSFLNSIDAQTMFSMVCSGNI